MNKKSLVLLCITIICVMAGYGLFMPIIPYLTNTMGVNPTLASLLLSLYALGQFISSPIFGNYADHNGSKKTLLVGMVGYFSTLALSLLVSNLFIMLSLRLTSGIFAGACVSSIENYIGKMTDDSQKSKNYTLTSLSIGIGMTIGPLLGIIYLIHSILIALLMGSVGLIIIIIVHKKITNDNISGQNEKQSIGVLINNLKLASMDNRNRYILMSFFLYGLITAGLEAIGIIYVMKFVKLSPFIIVSSIIYALILGLYVFIISPKIITKYNKLKLSVNLVIIIIIGITFMMCTPSPALIVLGVFLVFGAMTSLIICLTTFLTEINKKAGLMLGARNSALSLGSIIGPILLSTIYAIKPSLTMLGLLIVATIILLIGRNIRRINE